MNWREKLFASKAPPAPTVSQTSGNQSPNIVGNFANVSYGVGVPDPPLQMQVFPVTAQSRMHFRAQRVPFIGQATQLESLEAFLNSEEPFSWWLITGEAGSGKSRLALEVCLRHREAWKVGFLRENPRYDRWAEWTPRHPTLIVADYCSLRYAELQAVVCSLADRELPAERVRLLLVERSVEDDWWSKFLGTGSTQLLIQSKCHGEPLQTAQMSDGELWQAIGFLLEKGGITKPPDEKETINSLLDLDPLRRPLFAALAADALIAGRDIRSWDQTALLRDVLAREEDKFWKPAGITRQDKHLLCFATMHGGMLLDDLTRFPDGLDVPTTGPADPHRFDAGRYQTMTGLESTEFLAPLKPDVLGEFFVLEQLLPWDKADTDRVLNIAVLSWLAQPSNMLDFVSRVLQDFPTHPAIDVLAMSLSKSAIENIASLLTSEEGPTSEGGQVEWDVALLASAKSNFARACRQRGKLDEARLHCFELFEIADRRPTSDLLEKIALTTVPLCIDGTSNSRGIFRWIGERWQQKGRSTEYLELLVGASFLPMQALATGEEVDRAVVLCRELIWLLEEVAAPEEVYGSLAEGMRGLVASLGDVDKYAEADTVYELLGGLCRRAGNDTKFVVNWGLAGLLTIMNFAKDDRDEENRRPYLLQVFESTRKAIESQQFKDGAPREIGTEVAQRAIEHFEKCAEVIERLKGEGQ
jgi:hypothetical protein